NAIANGEAVISGKDGVVTQIRTAGEADGQSAHNLVVERKGPGKYHVEGTVQGKETKADFETTKPIWASWRERNEVRDKMLGGPKVRELTFVNYQPDEDALGASQDVWRATSEPNVFDTTVGTMQVRQTVDANGHSKMGIAKSGAVEM